ncbi:endoplasmic reticulum-golgi intermediate compartment protein 3-like protein [Lichtheimia hyalospora FSU 10163]|nr:endoplasmic reticulum-golgi intermediate compartment protein 3-like protein [Lichtheimia hyalospora FSU 10163]
MAKQGSFFVRFRNFDAYAKTLDDFRVKTTSGATVTVISALIIFYLVLSELIAYQTSIWQPELVVDKSRKDKMTIQFNVTFPKMPCHMLSLDIMDDSGEHITGYTHDVYKVRLDAMGQLIDKQKETKLGDNSHGAEMALQKQDDNECGSCYGATAVRQDGCCNTCDEIREAYANMGWGMGDPDQFSQCVRENWREKIEKQSNEGCNIHGRLSVNKVRGNFHIAPGKSFQQANMHVHDLKTYMQGAPDGHSFDMSHQIHSLTFGDLVTNQWVTSRALASTVTDPLAGTVKRSDKVRTVYQYFLKIVSTELLPRSGKSVYTNQYSVMQNDRVLGDHAAGLPGVFFIMDISPMQIIYREERPSFTSFLTGVCAIVGGIFTVAGLFDRVVYRAERALKKKRDLGKTL